MLLSITLRGSILWDDLTESNSASTSDGTGKMLTFASEKLSSDRTNRSI